MSTGEHAKMAAGEWYCCIDPELEVMREKARDALHEHNNLPPRERGDLAASLAGLFGNSGSGLRIEAPFHCAYGVNLFFGDNVFVNVGCTILDTARVAIGNGTLLGPHVQIYCAEHHKDAELRSAGLEIARPVDIGENVWIGGGAIILGGVRIGDGAIVGAGSVVTRSVEAGATVVGNPAKPIPVRKT